jgi:hypothetical protein
MKAASISELKKELAYLDSKILLDVCIRLAKYKKENKELLTYLLFEAGNETDYSTGVKQDLDQLFDEISNKGNLYLAKKSIRKILRFTNKQIKFSGIVQTELELRIYFCGKIKDSGIKIKGSTVLMNLYNQQIKKINEILVKLPDDLQYDYQNEIQSLSKL